MIDWITIALPYDWTTPIDDGRFVNLDRYGGTLKFSVKRLPIDGAYGATIGIRTGQNFLGAKFLEVSGNPSKFLQGHNVFGSDDLNDIVQKIIGIISELPSLDFLLPPAGYNVFSEPELNEFRYTKYPKMLRPTVEQREMWGNGGYTISRIDITEMLGLSSRAEVRAVINALKSSATMHYRGQGHWYDGTLYFGKTSKGGRALPWTTKIYCKGDELNLNEIPQNADDYSSSKAPHVWGGNLPKELPHRDNISAWADNKLRVELTLRTKELKKLGYYIGTAWKPSTAAELFRNYLSLIKISNPVCEITQELPSLSLCYQRTLAEWQRGIDVRRSLNRQTFARHRKIILDATDWDIATTPLFDPPTIDLRKLLVDEFNPCPIPVWAAEATSDIPF